MEKQLLKERRAQQILSLPKGAKFRIKLSEKLERKIRTYCALSPHREWSGVLFYKFDGDFENGITIHANDMYLMHQGTHIHTEFYLNEPEITQYMVFEGITDHCIGLLHSHCDFQTFFSGEDDMTLHDYGMEMNNFVSLIVNNEGKYTARLTRKAVLEAIQTVVLSGNYSYKLFNSDKEVSKPYTIKEENPAKHAVVEYVDLEIVKPKLEATYDDLERFGEINDKYSSVKTELPASTRKWLETEGTKLPVGKFKQGKLFDDFEDIENPFEEGEEELPELDWEMYGYADWFKHLVNGSLFDHKYYKASEINAKYKSTFQNESGFEDWFDTWLDYMMSIYDLSWVNTDSIYEAEELLLYKVKNDFNAYNLDFIDTINKVIDARL